MIDRIIDYKIDHLDLFDLEGNLEDLKLMSCLNMEAKTVIINGRPIIATGLRYTNDCTGTIWMVKSNYLFKHKIEIVKLLEQFIKEYTEKYKFKRLQTLITPENIKWIELLGFEKESELINFAPDKKVYLYRRVF